MHGTKFLGARLAHRGGLMSTVAGRCWNFCFDLAIKLLGLTVLLSLKWNDWWMDHHCWAKHKGQQFQHVVSWMVANPVWTDAWLALWWCVRECKQAVVDITCCSNPCLHTWCRVCKLAYILCCILHLLKSCWTHSFISSEPLILDQPAAFSATVPASNEWTASNWFVSQQLYAPPKQASCCCWLDELSFSLLLICCSCCPPHTTYLIIVLTAPLHACILYICVTYFSLMCYLRILLSYDLIQLQFTQSAWPIKGLSRDCQ